MQDDQLELVFQEQGLTEAELSARLNGRWRRPVRLTLTRNRASMITVRFEPDGEVVLRVHEAFLRAPAPVLAALVRYVRRRRRADWGIVCAFARGIPNQVAAGAERGSGGDIGRAAGQVYDLAVIHGDVNGVFFGGRVKCGIRWGRRTPRRRVRGRRRSMRFGSWDAARREIRIHPALDDERVPAEFVRYIVFHEMLHAVVPGVWTGGRRRDHTAQFRALERSFPKLAEMEAIAGRVVETVG